MKKPPSKGPRQLKFELNENSKVVAPANPQTSTVVRFVDSMTMQVRRDAVTRVASSGIFSLQRKK
jgi:hypothetical protein